jgi:isopenicillin-N epimerase
MSENRYGLAVRNLWALEPGLRFLNHGGYGATPVVIQAEQARLRAQMEQNPPRFLSRLLPGLLREAAGVLAEFVGTAPDRLAFVTNATAGVNAVLRALDFAPGDEILHTDHIYNAVRQTLRHVAGQTGAVCVEAHIGMPVTGPTQILDAITAACTPRTKLMVIDHVASASAVEFPVAVIAAFCRANGIRLLVDGAHAPGLLELDIDAIDADWYVGNCHKWLCAPKGAGFITISARDTPVIHPPVLSHAYGTGFVPEFDWTGTQDPTAFLAVPAAIGLHASLGGADLRARNRTLAAALAQTIAADLGTSLGADPAQFHAMVTIALPTELASLAAVRHIQAWLYDHHHMEAVVTFIAGRLYLRISVQAYTVAEDYEGIGQALREAIAACPVP